MRAALYFGTRTNRSVLIAFGVLAAASLLLSILPSGKAPSAHDAAPPAIATVMIAAHAIASGAVIGPSDVRPQTVPGSMPDGAFASQSAVAGQIAGRTLARGDVLLRADLHDPATMGIAGRLTDGQRAFSLRVAEDEIVGGFLQSGDHVDVFATIPGSAFAAKNAQDFADRSQSVLLLQNVLVLAVGENMDTKGVVQSGARTVSLSLTPPQLSRLALALRFGKTSIAIRKPGDDAVGQAAAATLADLIPGQTGAPQAAPAHAAAPHPAGIPFYAGTRTTSITWKAAP